MILIEKTEVMGFEQAIRGMRNPMNSWDKSDSGICKGGDSGIGCANCVMNKYGNGCDHSYDHSFQIGKNDHELMMKLVKGGPVHAKFRRMIAVYVDITAPLYWWKEFDTYKVGTVANSCSTMHKIHEKEFTIDDFSHDHLTCKTDGLWVNADGKDFMCSAYDFCQITCDVLNFYRNAFLTTNDKKYWWQMIQLLPSSYNQKRTVMLNYEVLAGIYEHRKNHKLDEWKEFCKWIEELPYSEIIYGQGEKMDNDILVVRVNMFLKNKEWEVVRQHVLEQRKTGIIVLPPYCESIVVPKDVEIKFEGVETDAK